MNATKMPSGNQFHYNFFLWLLYRFLTSLWVFFHLIFALKCLNPLTWSLSVAGWSKFIQSSLFVNSSAELITTRSPACCVMTQFPAKKKFHPCFTLKVVNYLREIRGIKIIKVVICSSNRKQANWKKKIPFKMFHFEWMNQFSMVNWRQLLVFINFVVRID